MNKQLAGLLPLIAMTTCALAQAEGTEDLAKRSADPTASLTSFNFRYVATPSYYGIDDEGGTVQFQPVVPFEAWGIKNILRATISYDSAGPRGSGLADVTIFDLLVFDKPYGRWGVGPVLQLLPDRGTGSDTVAAGPAIGFVTSKGRWTYGAFNQNLFGGNNTSISSLQPVLAYQLGSGWALSAGDAQWTMDWERGGWVNLPLGVQLSKVGAIGGQAVKWTLNPEYNMRDLDGAPEWTVRLGFSILVPGG